ncbi:CLIP domain-containing serine protease B15-like [Culex pipiens pallens]|uniref:CLIP domain-containing serine protease B15-like n=1 Tax=Culex pipiens pallens TaxID=42434 RepID=UPI0019538BDC|nr:CLIP domain-containing serine protease B15-like [Culex pipiens pallens]
MSQYLKNYSPVADYLCFIIWLIVLRVAHCQYLQSPCPDTFTYQADPSTNQIFGYIEINNIQVGQVAKLNVDLSIGTQLPSQNVGSITLIKSREATFNDIVRGEPAQYRVNFPLQNILPTVLNIALNGQTICTGHRAQGRIVTTINLEHTLYTQLANNGQNGGGFQMFPQRPIYQPQPQPQPQQPFPAQTRPTWNNEPQTTPPRVVQPRPTQPQRPRTTTAQVFRPQPVATTETPPAQQSTSSFTCGRPSSAFLNRLSINGELVEKGQFPWIVPLFDQIQPRNPKYTCGSTIITNRYLITAAHCVYEIDEFIRPERLIAVPGMYNKDNFFDENAKIVNIEKIIPNDEYVQEDDLNDADVAVLRMAITLTFTEFIIPVCPWQGENDLSKIVGQQGLVAGWGVTELGSTTSTPTYIKSKIVDKRQCVNNLQRMYSSNARIFCGDGEGSVPCNGDSGSGLVIKRGNQYYLRGVVSKGLVDPNTLKCDASKYAIYTDIALFRFWLRQVTQN